MAVKQRFKHDLKLISDEASKFMDDLSNLGKVLAEAGEDQVKETKENIEEYFTTQFAELKERMLVLKNKVSESAKVADAHVHTNPYPYILGSLGIGLLLGKIIALRSRD